MLTYEHISTVIEVQPAQKRALCLETDRPVGVKARPWNAPAKYPLTGLSAGEIFFGRMTENPTKLSWFLNRDNLLAKERLDDG